MNEASVKKTEQNAQINDFEDGLEYYAAEKSECQYIITEDKDDFWFSDLHVLNCEAFLIQLINQRAGKL